jgi:hypothetical protein
MKILRLLIVSFFFLTTLCTIYYIHMHYFRVDVLFYAVIIDGLLATFLTSMVLFFFKYFCVLNGVEKFQLVVIWLFAGYIFAISVPTVIDRSLSFYILEKLQQRGGEIKLDSFEDVFTQEYVKEHHLVEVRLTEQAQSGTLFIQNGCVKLTEKGNKIANFSRWFRKNLLPKRRLIMGEYTDALIDPFTNNYLESNYSCE